MKTYLLMFNSIIKKTALIILVFVVCSCSFNDDELSKGMWKYGKGYYIGDVFNLSKGFTSKDTIFRPYGNGVILYKIEYRFGKTGRELIIQSTTSNATGTYHQK